MKYRTRANEEARTLYVFGLIGGAIGLLAEMAALWTIIPAHFWG